MGLQLSIPARSDQRRNLKWAIAEGRLSDVKEILEGTPQLCSCRYKPLGNIPLHSAAAAGRDDIVDEVLGALYASQRSNSAKAASRAELKVVNWRNKHGQTPLMLACKSGNARCVRLLLGAGADATLYDGLSQSTSLHYAAQYGWPEVIDILLGDDSWMPRATVGGWRALLREAIVVDSQGLHKYIDGRASLGLTPLHLAVGHGNAAAAKALVGWGAALTARCNSFLEAGQEPWVPHSTPLHVAAAKGDQPIALLLLTAWAQQAQRQGLAAGPDPRILRDYAGRRPVDVALAGGHGSVLAILSPVAALTQLIVHRPTVAVPRLAWLAAAALRGHLSAQLERIAAQHGEQEVPAEPVEQPGEHAQQGQQAERLGQGQGCTGPGPGCPICLEHEPSLSDTVAGMAQDGNTPPQQQWRLVAAEECRHMLCMACARELCHRVGGEVAVRCPLCRGLVGRWVAATTRA